MIKEGKAVTVGSFDGVHAGHLEVIDCLSTEAARRSLRPLLLTFTSHPLATIAPERAPALLMTTAEKMQALADAGVEAHAIQFNKELQMLTAEKWMERMRDTLDARAIVVGYDNTFGCDGRSMHFDDYARLGAKLGIEIIRAPELEGVSSSALRRLVAAGDVARAASLGGRPYSLAGIVEHGRALGRTIGFPTANLHPDAGKIIPATGVYSAMAESDAIDGQRAAIVNIGSRPTVDDTGRLSIEAHMPGFSGDLYGHPLRITFIERLRDERRFDSLAELQAAIAADLARLP